MKKTIKIIAYLAIVVVVLVACALTYVTTALPNVGDAEDIQVEITPKRVERGKYLAMHVAGCMDCHSPHDWTKFGGPIDTTMIGAGGEKFNGAVGFPGSVTSANLTPYNLKNWTDGEILRAFTTGVKKDGSAIFPLMPWPYYSKMDKEDAYSIIAYIRTLKPIEKSYPKAELDFPLNIIVHTMPQKATLAEKPKTTDTVKYGAYLVQNAACMDCHSQDKDGELLPGLEFAGGKGFKMPTGTVRSANITPDAETGLGNWTADAFVARFKGYTDMSKAPVVEKDGLQTIMPWWTFAGMSEGDIRSIYAYLRTLKPVKNNVVKFTANSAQ